VAIYIQVVQDESWIASPLARNDSGAARNDSGAARNDSGAARNDAVEWLAVFLVVG